VQRNFCENAVISGLLGSGRFPKSINTGGVTVISFFDFARSSERVFSTPFFKRGFKFTWARTESKTMKEACGLKAL
jgi:hypothetical protein